LRAGRWNAETLSEWYAKTGRKAQPNRKQTDKDGKNIESAKMHGISFWPPLRKKNKNSLEIYEFPCFLFDKKAENRLL
jgi:hypothetical protein